MSGSSPDFGHLREFQTFAPETLADDLPAFELLRCVGQGSMGVVYEARERGSGDTVALKVLPPSLTLTERALARFLREGRIMAQIRHPHIVAFLDQGHSGRLHWFAMEFVRGVTLEERLRVGPLPVRQACAIIAEAGRALQYAHDRGVVHRDIKPGNIMLRDAVDAAGTNDETPRIAITDFGLARETGTGSMTESGAIVGTPMYMAPEVVLGGTQVAGTLADVYALGATLYALVTGQPPFDGPTAQGVLKALTERDPMPARRLRRDLPEPVEAMLEKAMSREPAHRYGSALEFAQDLDRFLRGERVLARRPGITRRMWRACARRPLITVLVAAVIALSIGAAQLVHERHRNEIQRQLADAERLLALAATSVDEQDRPRSQQERQDLLLQAVASASRTIAVDDGVALAWFVRARAYHRLRNYAEAIFDLDRAEQLRGGPSQEILHFRIDALRQQADGVAMRRVLIDLASLLELDQSATTRTLVAEQLLDFAARSPTLEARSALDRIEEVLAPVGNDNAGAAVVRARRLEILGDTDTALAAMKRATEVHHGNLYVHLQAAAMYDRNGMTAASQRETATAQGFQQGQVPDQAPLTPVDLDGLGDFLGEVDRVLHTLDRNPGSRAAAKPKAGTGRDGG